MLRVILHKPENVVLNFSKIKYEKISISLIDMDDWGSMETTKKFAYVKLDFLKHLIKHRGVIKKKEYRGGVIK